MKNDFKSLEIKRLELENNALKDKNKTLKQEVEKLKEDIRKKESFLKLCKGLNVYLNAKIKRIESEDDTLKEDVERLKNKVDMWHSHFLELRTILKKTVGNKKLIGSVRFFCNMWVIFVFLVLFYCVVMR